MSKLDHSTKIKGKSLLGVVLLIGVVGIAQATIVSNIRATKHNLSSAVDGTGNVPLRGVKAVGENQVCVFCHTPHNANQSVSAPLWNRALSQATYTPYASGSMDATTSQPTGNSKLCLSCHDGTLAIGTVGVLNGTGPVSIAMSGTGVGDTMPIGAGITTGFTRNVGIDLSNDHPISFPYDAALGGPSGSDGELRSPPVVISGITVVGNNVAGTGSKPTFPLQSDQLQCSTCHDPHLTDTNPANPPLKFLRGNRLQQVQPLGGLFDSGNDIMCLACHDKVGEAWAYSAHAHELVADETYTNQAADSREFARNTAVWQASCLNCHDTHSVEGSRQLLYEGTTAIDTPKSGGSSAMEQTCYQCHNLSGSSILDPIAPTNTTPDIKSDFTLNSIRMPISLQPEIHSIGGNFDNSPSGGSHCNMLGDQCGKDLVESQALLGKVSAGGSLLNRHAECTDCHNPHRATKNRLFNANSITPDAAGTHKHGIVAGDTAPHNNLASGSLRGSFGVEPTYLSAEFGSYPTGFDVKRGDTGGAISDLVTSTYVTREYQICLKCHSNFAFDDLTPPPLPLASPGSTPRDTNGVKYYSDAAMEFQAPITHQGEPASTTDSGASTTYSANNHRSWHPVMAETGRTAAVRSSANSNLWRTPWNGSDTDGGIAIVPDTVGTQTMNCSDCHGSTTNLADGVVPFGGEDGASWGPHGSNEDFLLKGSWLTDAPNNHATGSNNLCFRCHEESQYADASAIPATTLSSGFGGIGNDVNGVPITNLHQRHAFYTTQGGVGTSTWPVSENGTYRCTMCHTGTAHGWKNKAFLANLNDLGPEVRAIGGEIAPGAITLNVDDPVPIGTAVTPSFPAGYSNGSYYRGTLLSIAGTGFPASGNWAKGDCSTSGCHTP